MVYQFFGSGDSRDTDVVFFIKEMPASIFEKAALCKEYSNRLARDNNIKHPVNGNLAVLHNGYLSQVFKGTADELNNALHHTYALHQQVYANQVHQLLQRDVNLKFIRCTRMILSALTRTLYRPEVKKALLGDLNNRISTLQGITLEAISTAGKGYTLTDMKKLLAFQLGQTLALHEGTELYTKEGIATRYPYLSKYLQRAEQTDWDALQLRLQEFLSALERRAAGMKVTVEYDYPLPGFKTLL